MTRRKGVLKSTPRRVLIKLSGEALGSGSGPALSPEKVDRFGAEISEALRSGVRIAVVIGGGNFLRGAKAESAGLDRVVSDQMGMLATIMNGLFVRQRLRASGLACELMSALPVERVCGPFVRDEALDILEGGAVLVLAGGTGHPYFSTDTAAALRAAELGADLLAKATKVDGVYDRDPALHRKAVLLRRLGFDEMMRRRLAVMDASSVALCRENAVSIRVFNFTAKERLRRLLAGEDIGTLISERKNA